MRAPQRAALYPALTAGPSALQRHDTLPPGGSSGDLSLSNAHIPSTTRRSLSQGHCCRFRFVRHHLVRCVCVRCRSQNGTRQACLHPAPLAAIQPRGWLEQQLRVQASGLSGHLYEIWPNLGPHNGWLGGTGESWESRTSPATPAIIISVMRTQRPGASAPNDDFRARHSLRLAAGQFRGHSLPRTDHRLEVS
jgi:hypothetical protein